MKATSQDAKKAIAGLNTEKEKMMVMIQKYCSDVQIRRNVIIHGVGFVNGANQNLKDQFGLGDLKIVNMPED